MTSVIATTDACPKCGYALVSERGAVPWCGFCEWNLDAFEPKRRKRELSWAWQDRLAFRLAYRMNARQFEALRGAAPTPPSFSVADAFVTVTSLFMLAFVAGLAALGIYVAVYTQIVFPWFIGGLLVLIAIALRPRFGKLDRRAHQLSRTEAPELLRLIDEVAAAIGVKPPHVVLAVPGMTAYSHAYGIRRRRVLAIGMPLWASLAPQQRVALLGHELGHFGNGDVASRPLNAMAFRTLGLLADMTVPPRGGGFLELFATITMGAVHHVLAMAQAGVTALALRSTQRAEYYADGLAAWAGGSRAAIGLMDVLLLAEGMGTVVRAAARRSNDVGDWIAAGQRAQAELAPRVPRLRQLDKRDEASLFSTHPPSGLRAAMLESRGELAPAVVLTEVVSARIDAELAKPYRYMIQNT